MNKNRLTTFINRYRKANRVNPLCRNKELDKVAYEYSVYMYTNSHFAHKDLKWHRVNYRIKKSNYWRLAYYWENLSRSYWTARSIMKAWMNSPTHDEAMKRDRYEDMGIGYYKGYCTLVLASKMK